MKIQSKISGLRTASALTALILALPLPFLKGLTGLHLWLSPFIMLNSAITLRSFAFMNTAALLILILITIHKRWFCANLCPAGWLLDNSAGKNKSTKFTYKRIPEIGKWIAVISLSAAIAGIPLFIFLDPVTVLNGFITVFAIKFKVLAIITLSGFLLLFVINLFLPGLWCRKICPLGGLQMVVHEIKSLFKKYTSGIKETDIAYNPGRRYTLMSLSGLLAGVLIRKSYNTVINDIILPPASVGRNLFSSLCCRCGSCIKACPTSIIGFNTGPSDLLSFMTPEVKFGPGYCLEECNLCSRVCPTGAIALFDPDAKGQLFMGSAVITLPDCRLLNNSECNKCLESCKYGAIMFYHGSGYLNMFPVVDEKKCVGCGACMVVCPESCIIIRPVNSKA
ncbi:MAG: 4Fe-4S dicluster domain-containing protein [Bacteroidales bacterium]|nr:4Fe-4S dicluster domain-containing protein [Bacteroidales bacterium]